MASDPQTWTELKASMAEWLNRSDLTSKLPEFIAFAERKFNRTLMVPDREETSTASTSGARLALPTDFWRIRSIYLDSDPKAVLQEVSPMVLRRAYPDAATGQPVSFSINGRELVFGPSPDTTYTVVLEYYQTIPALGATQATNWLLTDHPDLYLYGSLLQAEAYLFNDDRLAVWKTAHDEVMAEIMTAGNAIRSSTSGVRIRNPVNYP